MAESDEIIIKTPDEIKKIREASRIVAQVLDYVEEFLKPGVSTAEISDLAEKFIVDRGARPAFKGYSPSWTSKRFPGAVCVSVNEVVLHGVPSRTIVLKDGDIVKVDVGVELDGYYGDGARSYIVGNETPYKRKLLETARGAVQTAISIARPGKYVKDISRAIQRYVEGKGFVPIKDFTGHGVGKYIHEAPAIPNRTPLRRGPQIVPGMTLAIEVMVMSRSPNYITLSDGWSVASKDGLPTAHWEHTIAITENGPEILTLP